MKIEWLHMIDEYLDEVDTWIKFIQFMTTAFASVFIWASIRWTNSKCLPLVKSEQHRLTPKYDILYSFLTLVKHDYITEEDK